jgi:ABC-type polysaccharide/polyol phosphate export permease
MNIDTATLAPSRQMMPRMVHRLGLLWQWRGLLVILVGGDLRLRYKGSALGMLWSLMHPLALATVYVIALRFVIRIQMENYAIFLLAGLLPWVFFATALSSAASSIAEQGNLVKKLAFPREVLPLVRILSQFVHFAIGYLVVVPVFAGYQIGLSTAYLALPIIMVLLMVFTSGLALALATAQVYFRDTQHLLNVVLQLWFWLTPILYSLQLVPERFRPLALINPLTIFMLTYQDIVVGQQLPGASRLVLLLAVALAALVAGYAVFIRGECRMAEYV